MTRTGKIARLPLRIREELNQRLQDGEPGRKLVTWLNSLPDVRAILAADFGGRPIRPQNLSEWRQGGYRDWLEQRETEAALASIEREVAALDSPDRPPLTDTLARWLAARYTVASRRLGETEGPEHWRLLRDLCADVAELRRGDHASRRLELERLRVESSLREADLRWKRKLIVGLEALGRQLGENPAARAAFEELSRHLQHPFDPAESDQIRPPDPESVVPSG